MAIKVPDVGLKKFALLTQAGLPQLHVKLFKNNITPAVGDTAAVYTEADFSGYAEQVLAANLLSWFAPPLLDNVNHRYQINAPDVAWNGNGGGVVNNIYGVYVVDDDGLIWWAERLAGVPIVMGAAGSNITWTPTLTFKSEF